MVSPALESLIASCLCVLAMLLTAAKALHLFPLQCARRCAWRQLPWRSGDVLLFSLHGLKEDLLKFCFHSHITHVGMVVTDTAGRRYVWEATRRGCALVPLESYNFARHSVCLYRALRGPPVPPAALRRAVRANLGRPYSHDYWRPVYNRFFPYLPLATPAHRRTRFCTDLVAETLARVGVLDFDPTDRTPAETLPSDFTEKQQDLPLTPAYTYDHEIMIAC